MRFLIQLLLTVLLLVSFCKIYEKAGRKCWEGIIPFYNTWVLAEIVGKQGWLGILIYVLAFVPIIGWIASLVIYAYLMYLLTKSFGKEPIFALGLILLPIVFFPILAFGDAEYKGIPKDDIADNFLKK